MRIVAFDPGGTTGFAVFSWEAPDLPKLVWWGSFPLYHDIEGLLGKPLDVVVYEQVTINSAAIRDDGVRVIGVIQFLCWRRGIPTVAQSPSILRSMYKLVDTSGFVGSDVHSLEAALHGIYYLQSQKFLKLPTKL